MENELCERRQCGDVIYTTHTESLMRDVLLKVADKAGENGDVSIQP